MKKQLLPKTVDVDTKQVPQSRYHWKAVRIRQQASHYRARMMTLKLTNFARHNHSLIAVTDATGKRINASQCPANRPNQTNYPLTPIPTPTRPTPLSKGTRIERQRTQSVMSGKKFILRCTGLPQLCFTDKSSKFDKVVAKCVAKWGKRLQIQIKRKIFDSFDPNLTLGFLSKLKFPVVQMESTKASRGFYPYL